MSHIPTPWGWWNSETRHTVSWFIIVCTIYVVFCILLALLCTCSIWFSLPACMLYIVLLQTSTTRSQCLFIHSSWLLLLFLASYWLLDMCSVSLLTIFSLTLEMDNCPICSRSVLPQAKQVKYAVCYYTPRFNEVERGVYWYHLVRLSICPSVDRIVSALYLQQYSLDPFHICTSYQATSEGVFSFCWWRHNQLLMTSQWPDICDPITWIVISNS